MANDKNRNRPRKWASASKRRNKKRWTTPVVNGIDTSVLANIKKVVVVDDRHLYEEQQQEKDVNLKGEQSQGVDVNCKGEEPKEKDVNFKGNQPKGKCVNCKGEIPQERGLNLKGEHLQAKDVNLKELPQVRDVNCKGELPNVRDVNWKEEPQVSKMNLKGEQLQGNDLNLKGKPQIETYANWKREQIRQNYALMKLDQSEEDENYEIIHFHCLPISRPDVFMLSIITFLANIFERLLGNSREKIKFLQLIIASQITVGQRFNRQMERYDFNHYYQIVARCMLVLYFVSYSALAFLQLTGQRPYEPKGQMCSRP